MALVFLINLSTQLPIEEPAIPRCARCSSSIIQTLAGLNYASFQSFFARETEGFSSVIVTAAKRALPYLVRQQTWETVAYLIQHIAGRDESSRTLALMLPWLERAAQVQAELGEHGLAAGVLERMLVAAGRKDEAESRFRELIALAIEHDDYGTASALVGDLTNLLRDMGRYEIESAAQLSRHLTRQLH